MGNTASGRVVTNEDISMESADPEVVLTNSDIEDVDATTPEEGIPNWVRWATLGMPVVVKPTEDDAKNGIGKLHAVMCFNGMTPGKIKDTETELQKVSMPRVVALSNAANGHHEDL